MKKNKKILKGLSLPLALVGILCSGGLLLNDFDKNVDVSSADFSVVENLVNEVPEYLKVEPKSDDANKDYLSYANDNLFLFQADQYFDLVIADKTIKKSETEINYAYIPEHIYNTEKSTQVYYYFDFQSSLSLYYNLTSEDIAAGFTDKNLISTQQIANYAKAHDNSYAPTDTSLIPQKFDIQFKLDLQKDEIDFSDNSVTLTEEGCYTIVIPVVEYYTTNGGATFTSQETTITYTFMAFNANTYFDPTTGKPKLKTSDNMHQALLGSSSSEFSTYYYYNFATDTLPQITYNPNHYQIKINYTDIDNDTKSVFVQYQNENIVQLNENGNQISEEDEFIKVKKNADNTATLTFYDIGSYDINITYLYTVSNANGTTTYYLPFENLKPEENNTIFKNKAQRLYIYGYQAVYSDYSNTNPETNQPESVDLKVYDFENGMYKNSADITSKINKLTGMTGAAQDGAFTTISDTVKNAITSSLEDLDKTNDIEPISTNQTPVKFLTNATNQEVSQIFTKTSDGWSEASKFQGFNENRAGTYLYIVQYTFDSYMSTNGTLQSLYYHYQIFYFTITNTAPTVDVIEMSEDYNEVYTNGFTNKSVYILNNSENNNYDAQVNITLSAKNYKTKTYFFPDTNIKNLSSYGLYYQKFEKNTELADDSEYNTKIANKYGLLIENTNRYANAEFTIKISTITNKQNPDEKPTASTRTFTIDTNPISNISSRNVTVQTSTNYRIINSFDGYITNSPLIFSWDKKLSGAQTYGYVKYIPTSAINYYSSLDKINLSELLSRLIDSHDTLPVSYKIDFSKASTWTEYKNSFDYSLSIPSTYVKSNDGFYILEVYDQAGNVGFEIFLLDSSSPIFLEEISGDTTSQKLISNSESISVPENNTDITIKWTKNKAIYLDNMTDDVLQNISAYQYGINVAHAENLLKEKINSFFTTANDNIKYFNDITAETTASTDIDKIEAGLIPTGISSFNGNYFIIPIEDKVYIKEGTSSTFAPFETSSYQIEFFNDNGELIADNTTYKILLRDQANTYDTLNEEVNYKNYPSGYLSFNVTSDASKLMLQALNNKGKWESVDFSTYSLSGVLYSYNDADENKLYTHTPDLDAEDENGEKIYSETDLEYKFSYYSPINGKNELRISYIPVADNGSKLQKVDLKYYPYELKSQEKNGNFYYYYDITTDETKTKTVNIFTASDKTYEQGKAETFEIALGTDSFPLAGRYVIERSYMEDSTTDTYDYFRRTLTFTVDNFNLISPLESVSNNKNQSSLESVIGGDIILSMYSGANNSEIHVSFPSYSEDTGLSSGSFYTKDSFSENDDISYAVEGNKLPMTLYIPKHKYTVSTTEHTIENGITYSVNKNYNLSYYGNATWEQNPETMLFDVYVEGVLVESFASEKQAQNYLDNYITINEYEIFAKIQANVIENGNKIEKYYYSDGSDTNGYLNFYQGDKSGKNIDKTQLVENFFLEGDYVVTIYQANNIGSTSNFYTFYKFGFTIKSKAPDFDLIGSNGYDLIATNTPNVYYTNSSELKVQWKVPESKYEAQIDESNITIATYPSTATYTTSSIEGTTTRSFTIDTTSLINANNSYIEITMQYQGHNFYYSKITKRIYFDRSAPTQNLQGLMTLTENATNRAFTTNYQLMYMRRYANYDGNEMTIESVNDIVNASYSYSINTNNYFKYYSYNVSTNFFYNTLLKTVQNAGSNPYDTQYVYYKAIDNLDTYNQAERNSFSPGKPYFELVTYESPILYSGYYEIVEMDYAGNMTVYVVYLTDSTVQDDPNVRNDALTYSNSRTLEDTIYNEEIQNGFNIYSTSNFELKGLNYKSDPWAILNVQIAGQAEKRYLKSPWLNDSQIYQMTFTSSGINFNQVSLKSIFEEIESSSNKHKLTFTDRTNGTSQLVYLSIMDASISPAKVEDPTRTSAILNIDVPTVDQVKSATTAYIYPVNIRIYQYDTNIIVGEPWVQIMDANQNPYGTWTPTNDFLTHLDYISFTTLTGGKTLQIAINLGANATQKVKYLITDNFEKTTTVIQLANEVGYREITGISSIYSDVESDSSITYLSDNTISYSYNILLYSIEIYDRNELKLYDDSEIPDNMPTTISINSNPNTNISVVSFSPSQDFFYDDYYKIYVWDIESDSEKPLKTLHIRLYNKLPFRTNTPSEVENGGIIFNDKNQQPIEETNIGRIPSITVNHNGKNYTSSGEAITTFSQNVTVRFKNGQDLAFEGGFSHQNGYPYSVYLSSDNGLTWENINSATSDTSGYTISGVGEYIILIKYDSEEYFTNLCRIFTVSILDSSASYYYITVDGLPVEKSDIKYLSLDNREYDVNYIVSVDYSDKNNRLKITENEELGVKINKNNPIVDNTGTLVTVEIYHYECEESVGDFTIIYIAQTNNIVNTLTYETASGSTTSIKDKTSETVVANNETEPNFNKLKINFSSFYGINTNKINVEVLKLFNGVYTEIQAQVYTSGENSYIYLEQSGSYRLKFYDSCSPMNVQAFKNSQYFEIIFLSYVPFVVTQTDNEGNSVVTEPIQRAVYNGAVSIKPTNLSSYYQTSGYPTISVKLNGHDYTGFETNNRVYTFTTPGYYTIKFTAKSTTGIQVREEEFNFTIVNPNESRDAYEFTQYDKYYVEQVIKDGIDITEDLINMSNFEIVSINGKKYLASLSINHLDNKTGEGKYKVVINHNKANLSNVIGKNFAFEFWINHVTSLPIKVATSDGILKEGEKTSKDVTISFNVQNLYNAVGDCYIKVGDLTKYYTAENISNYGQTDSITILASGTYFVQVYTTGGKLLYSFKVVKTEPLNAFAIIAIIIGVIALAAVIFITIKIRKRQRVK